MGIFQAFEEKPKDFHFASQEKDETVIFVLRRTFITNVPWLLMSLVLFLIPVIYINFTLGESSFALFIGSRIERAIVVTWYIINTIYFIENFLSWYFNIYVITDKRLVDIDFVPLFNKKIAETTYDRVEDSSYTINSFWGTVFNFGDVFIQTAGSEREFDFNAVPKPDRVQDIVSDYVAKHKRSLH